MRYVVGFMFSSDLKRVALIRKLKPEWQKGLLNGIGGKIEDGECEEAAMIREFFEETGFATSGPWRHYSNLDGDGFKVTMFACRGDLSRIATREEEKIEIIEIDNIHLSSRGMVENTAWLLGLAMDCLTDGRPHLVEAFYL